MNIIADWKERIDNNLQPLHDQIDIETYSYLVRCYHEKTGIGRTVERLAADIAELEQKL